MLLLFHASVLLVVTFLVYWNTFSNDFAFDDWLGIVNNKDVKADVPFIDLWRHDIWGKHLLEIGKHLQ